ncbi:hypothetical protein BGZ83_002971, partial [Gryganskiella cystojenkinii]
DFEATLEYASELDVVLWSNPKKRMLCITAEGHQAVGIYVRKLISRHKEMQAQQAQHPHSQHQQQQVSTVSS